MSHAIAFLLNSKYTGLKRKRLEFECSMDSTELYSNFIRIMKRQDSYPLPVVLAATKVMWRLIMLDLHPDF